MDENTWNVDLNILLIEVFNIKRWKLSGRHFFDVLHSPDRQHTARKRENCCENLIVIWYIPFMIWIFYLRQNKTIFPQHKFNSRIGLNFFPRELSRVGKCILIDRNLIIILAYWTRLHVCGHIHWQSNFKLQYMYLQWKKV